MAVSQDGCVPARDTSSEAPPWSCLNLRRKQRWLCLSLRHEQRDTTVAVSQDGCVSRWLCLKMAVSQDSRASRWLCLKMAVPQDGCVSRWLCLKMAVPQDGCASRWLCLKMAVPQDGCVSRWLCLKMAGCVSRWLCLKMAVSQDGCPCLKMAVSQDSRASRWLCLKMAVPQDGRASRWLCLNLRHKQRDTAVPVPQAKRHSHAPNSGTGKVSLLPPAQLAAKFGGTDATGGEAAASLPLATWRRSGGKARGKAAAWRHGGMAAKWRHGGTAARRQSDGKACGKAAEWRHGGKAGGKVGGMAAKRRTLPAKLAAQQPSSSDQFRSPICCQTDCAPVVARLAAKLRQSGGTVTAKRRQSGGTVPAKLPPGGKDRHNGFAQGFLMRLADSELGVSLMASGSFAQLDSPACNVLEQCCPRSFSAALAALLTAAGRADRRTRRPCPLRFAQRSAIPRSF
eukprot:gene9724-biopygen10637